MQVTIKDIALAAGVSPGVVSCVLNDGTYTRISKKRRSEIKDLARKLGYVPNLQAVSLRRGENPLVGVFLPEWLDLLLLELVHGLSAEAFRSDIPLVYNFGMTSKTYASFLDKMNSRQNIAIISYVPYWEKDFDSIVSRLNEFVHGNGKVIAINSYAFPLEQVISVDFDDQRGGELAANFMLERPELKSILLVTCPAPCFECRAKAFCRVLSAHGIENRSFDFHYINFSVEIQDLVRLIKELPRPIGIFFTVPRNIGKVIEALEDENLQFGRDMLGVCYDYSDSNPYVEGMYTIKQSFYELGVVTIKTLAKMLNNAPVKSTTLVPKLERIINKK
ncbi:MAG: LacI family transcriptional regulator [Lentisphaerae bacterium]|jgi:LacI family transcriptional regulator|nr:LacI family transcriptional regulator [Lentisphaerota bacterium]